MRGGLGARRAIRPSRPDVVQGRSRAARRSCARSRLRCGLLGPVRGDPRHAPLVVAEQQVGGLDRLDDLRGAGVHDRAGQPGGHRHRQERRAEGVPAGHAERHVGRAAGHVDAELVADPAHRLERGRPASRGVGADRHRQRVDHDVGLGDAVLLGRDPDDLARSGRAACRPPSGSRRGRWAAR